MFNNPARVLFNIFVTVILAFIAVAVLTPFAFATAKSVRVVDASWDGTSYLTLQGDNDDIWNSYIVIGNFKHMVLFNISAGTNLRFSEDGDNVVFTTKNPGFGNLVCFKNIHLPWFIKEKCLKPTNSDYYRHEVSMFDGIVLYSSAGNELGETEQVWRWDTLSGKTTKVTNGFRHHAPQWSGKGEYYTVETYQDKKTPPSIEIYNADDSLLRKINYARDVAWAPITNTLLYRTLTLIDSGNSLDGGKEDYYFGVDKRLILVDVPHDDFYGISTNGYIPSDYEWSKDESEITFTSLGNTVGLHVIDLFSRQVRTLTVGFSSTHEKYDNFVQPFFYLDGVIATREIIVDKPYNSSYSVFKISK